MKKSLTRVAVAMLLGLVAGGCGASRAADSPAVIGRRVQGTDVLAHGAVPYRVSAYELVFAEQPGSAQHARRAALLVDLVGGRGPVRGFAEWGRPGEPPKTYAVGGWAKQRSVRDELVTVFELSLIHLAAADVTRVTRAPDDFAPVAVRVVVNEASGDVTLIRRQ